VVPGQILDRAVHAARVVAGFHALVGGVQLAQQPIHEGQNAIVVASGGHGASMFAAGPGPGAPTPAGPLRSVCRLLHHGHPATLARRMSHRTWPLVLSPYPAAAPRVRVWAPLAGRTGPCLTRPQSPAARLRSHGMSRRVSLAQRGGEPSHCSGILAMASIATTALAAKTNASRA